MSTTPNEREAFEEIARLMRWIDGYAFDYAAEGKLGTSRLIVEKELAAALAEARSSIPPSDHIGDGNKMVANEGVDQSCEQKAHGWSSAPADLTDLHAVVRKHCEDLQRCAALLEKEPGFLATAAEVSVAAAELMTALAAAGAKPEPEGEAVKLVLPEMPDLRFHGEYRRGYDPEQHAEQGKGE